MRDSIYNRMIKSAWKRDLFATICFVAFVAISVAMTSLTAMLFKNLTGAIDHLMDVAKTPDYLQMHFGDVDSEALVRFVSEHPEIEKYQVLQFLNLDNSVLSLNGKSLLESTQDNGLSMQGDGFDYMLDLDNEIPEVTAGQIYVPVCYESIYHVSVGDIMTIDETKLKVAGFIRDSQMNSMMASSKRFLVCKEDYEKIKPLGQEEYLIEFLLEKDADSNALKTAYENAGLPMNGPTITGPLIKMMNTLSDGIMIFIILLISLLALLISLVCIRFMLLTRVISEAKEVGVLKTLGISGKEVRAMFLKRYGWLIGIGIVFGIALSVLMFEPLSGQMKKLYGISQNGYGKYLFAVLGAAFISAIILLSVVSTLRKLNEMTAIKALTGRDGDRKRGKNKLCITFVLAICLFLMMIPVNLYNTLSAPDFVTYMGIGNAQIRMDFREGITTGEDFLQVAQDLKEDEAVAEYSMYQTMSTPVELPDGTHMNMLMEEGDHTSFPVTYNRGREPSKKGEVALSYLLSKELLLEPGDTLLVKNGSAYESCTITGIYSDITNGGKTAKIYKEQLDSSEEVMWRIAYVTLKEGFKEESGAEEFMEEYAAKGAEVVDIRTRVLGTYGPTLLQIQRASVVVKLVASAIVLLVIMFFIRMIIANERYQISIKKAIGYGCSDIKKDFWKSCVPYSVVGVAAGTVLGCTLGEVICAVALQSLGAVGFSFVLKPGAIGVNILLGIVVTVAAVYLSSFEIQRIRAMECCRGRE